MTIGDTDRRAESVPHIDDLWEGDLMGVIVDGKPVVLVNIDGTVYAYANRCPHQEFELSDGDLEETTLTCSRHLWEFDVTTGCGINPADARLAPYPCHVDADGTIVVDVTGGSKPTPGAAS
ncbi:Rieske (2Fe-2S) protein [Nocardia miyunensis]|uniref:Rieske (2Fe-2S) protein n=1 Tax=Nocardia miyunensis TaxID=282684 RepID=UPI00082DB9C7|nr:Rieske 2Fe-2S domain-containing protein [Nocardia miyunensis]